MKKGLRSQKGAAALEFAIVLPLFLMLLFGVVEFGLIMYAKGTITLASRAGARFGVVYMVPRRTEGAIQTQVQNYLSLAGVTANAQVTVTGAGGASGSPLTVTVQVLYRYLILPVFVPGQFTMTAQTVMPME